MKILATGLSGTLGRQLVQSIEPARVTLGQDRLKNHHNPNGKPLTVIHLAGIVGEKRVKQDLEYSELVNVTETLNLAREVIEDFRGKFIHISTSHVYGPQNGDISEETPFNPQSKYAEQKARAEEALIEHFGQNNPQLIILRVFSVLGWDVASFTLGGLVRRIRDGSKEKIACADDVRDFMAPRSISKAISTIATAEDLFGTYNLSTGKGISVRDAVASMFEQISHPIEMKTFESGNSSSPRIVGSNLKLSNTHLKLNLTWNPADANE